MRSVDVSQKDQPPNPWSWMKEERDKQLNSSNAAFDCTETRAIVLAVAVTEVKDTGFIKINNCSDALKA